MSYTVKRNVLGKQRVLYKCLHCASDLDSPLEEAGQKFECPTCRRRVITPGEAELEKIKQAEVIQHQKQQQFQQIELEKIREAAEAKLKADQIRRQEMAAKEARDTRDRAKNRIAALEQVSPADRFLAFVFRLAKAISVAVISICLLVIIGCLSMFVLTMPEKPATPKPFLPPIAADYKADQAARKTSQQSTDANQVATPPPSRFETREERLQRILLRYDANTGRLHLLFNQMPRDCQEELIPNIEQFLQALNAPKGSENADAAEWYISKYAQDWQSVKQTTESAAAAQRAAELEAALRRQALLTGAGSAGVALLAFLFLPLLIQVEQNTRRSLELQTLTRASETKNG